MKTEINTTSPPMQHPPEIGDPDIRGFVWFTVLMKIGICTFETPAILDESLAVELALELGSCEPTAVLRISNNAARIDEIDQIRESASRHKDLIVSVRSAAEPGREYLLRLGYWIEADLQSPAPQNHTTPNRGAHAEVRS